MSLGTLTARVALDTSGLSAGVARAGMAFAAVAAGAAAAIYKVGSSYETSLNTFQAVSRASADQMAQVSSAAKALGADMTLPATSAADAAKAMTELAKAGMSVDDALKAAKGTLQLAAAAQVDEAEAARITANALNMFGLAADKAGYVTDILANSANASSAEITDMADALRMSGAVMRAAGVPIADTAAMLGVLANNGIKGQDAGTSLKQTFLSLQSPSKAAAKAIREMGVDVYDANGKMYESRNIIDQFNGAMKRMNQEQRDAALSTIFGSDAVRAANIIFGEGVGAFDNMKAAAERAGGGADVAAAKTKGLKGAFEGLKSQLEGVAISIYEKVAPGIERFVRSVAEGIPGVVATLSTAGKAFAAAFSGEGITSDGFVGTMEQIGVAARALVDWFRANWPEIKAIVTDVMSTVQVVVAGTVDAIQTIWRNFGEQIVSLTAGHWEGVRSSVSGALEAIRGVVQAFTAVLNGDMGAMWEGIKAIFAGAWDFLRGGQEMFNAAFAAVVSAGWEVIKSIFAEAWGAIQDMVRAGAANIVDIFLGMAEGIIGAAAAAFGWLPVIGDDIRRAADSFEEFRDRTNAALRGTDSEKTITINTYENTYVRKIVESMPADAVTGNMATGGVIGLAAGGMTAAAAGMRRGFKTNGPRILVGEGNPSYPEYVIATDPLYRMRNMGLLNQAAKAMGADSGGGSMTPAEPIDYTRLAAALAPVLADAVAANPIRASVSASDVAKGLHERRRR